MEFKKIELQKEKGIYLLTEEAVEIIKNATSLIASFKSKNGQRIETECWLRAWTTTPIFSTSHDIGFDMPINIRSPRDNMEWEFKASANMAPSREIRHALPELIQPGAAIYFLLRPDVATPILHEKGLVEDIIHWEVDDSKKVVAGIFYKRICEPDAVHRLIKQTRIPQHLI